MTDVIDKVYKDQHSIRFVRGKWKTLLLIHENFLFQRFNGNFPKTTWRCKAEKCEVTVSTNNGIFVEGSLLSIHYHPPATDQIVRIESDMRMMKRVKTEFNLSPRQIHSEERMQLKLRNEHGAHLMMDSFAKYKRNLYRYRSECFPKNTKSREEVDLVGQWTLTLDQSEPFVLADDGIENRILIFGTENNLRLLCNADYVISDGTFSVHPDIFAQLYVFHAPYLGQVMPLLFCLLPDKTFNTYSRLIELIKSAVQCIWRKVQELGLSVSYKKQSDVREWIRRFIALPLLPPEDTDEVFIEIHESAPNPQNNIITLNQIQKFHDYMIDTWIHEDDAKIDRNLWNQFHNAGPRTTNNAEGWNHKLNQMAKTRLSFFQFIHLLQTIQVDLDVLKFDLISESPSKRQNKYKIANEKLALAKKNYESGNVPILQYLDSVSYAIKVD